MTSIQTHPQGTFNGSRNLQLFYQSWYPPACGKPSMGSATNPIATNPIKGVLAIVHGLGEHSGRYCSIVEGLTAAGYAVFGFDNQGHGKSEGQRGHIESWKDYRDNTQAFLQLVRRQEPTAPLFLMGHSLGGLIVLDYVLRSARTAEFEALNLEGIVVSAPPIQPMESTASSIRIVLARLLSGVLPRVSLKMGLSQDALSRDQTVTEQAVCDPLTHSYVTLRWGSETLSTIDWVKKHIQQLRLPILLTHGEADPIVAPDGTRAIYQQIESPNKALNIYPGSYHEPHNDLDAKSVVADLVSWLEKGCAAT